MPPTRQLTLLDSTSIIVGIIIGSGIYKSAAGRGRERAQRRLARRRVDAGGVLSLVGALCYAELATMLSRKKAAITFTSPGPGPLAGFSLRLGQIWVVRPGSIGALAYVFADYANRLVPLRAGGHATLIYAAAPRS